MNEPQSRQNPTNRLIHESSPYLLQHAHNPVDWFPWGDEAFAQAKELDRPIFLSVGYSACHWCHVMEHESFEDVGIAQLLNDNFVSIKVDREERPDVDQIYMTAVQLITRRGGWPMSVFMTPDGKPFFGGTYWPPTSRMGMPGFRDILLKLADYWKNKRDEVDTSADQLVQAIQQMSAPVFQSVDLNAETLSRALDGLRKSADRRHGGFGSAPKFPHPMDLRLLLRGYERFGNEDDLKVATTTLDKMLYGGIYDQLGGGFHRYSTDAYWLVPHFEKMLYDNALLVPVYVEAWQVTRNPEYKRAVEETLEYVRREMTSPEGGFYSTQDADSEGDEGKYFVWTSDEIREYLGGDEAELFIAAYDVTSSGNWEGKTILNRPRPLSEIAEERQIDLSELERRLAASRAILFERRKQRVSPGRDEKILTAWNGMMISALAQAGFVFNAPEYLSLAVNAADFLLQNMRHETGDLLHCFKDGQAKLLGYLDDYACLIDGFVELFQATSEGEYLTQAVQLADVMIDRFHDAESGGFFFTARNHERLIARTKDIQDNAVPSGNGMAATALLRLSQLSERQDFQQVALKTLDAFAEFLAERPAAAGQALIALDFELGPKLQIVVTPDLQGGIQAELLELLRHAFLPNSVIVKQSATSASLVGSLVSGKTPHPTETQVFVCEQGACFAPARSVVELACQLKQIRNIRNGTC